MTQAYLPQFRRRLYDWLQIRLASGRTPFQRVEECPAVLTGQTVATPDLVLWINRDSLLAGAMIVIPRRSEPQGLLEASVMAQALGLRQFVTWEAREVNIWDVGSQVPARLKNWPLPAADTVCVSNFALVFEQLLLELKNLVVAAALPAAHLPPAYFANLCLQVLNDTDSVLQESARLAASPGQPDTVIRQAARDKGWMTLWRLLALRWHDRFPPGVNPERLDRALGYAISGLEATLSRQLAPPAEEPPLPESAAIRFHHLAGRLAQLAWNNPPERALQFLQLLLAESAREARVATSAIEPPPGRHDLLVNCLPPQPLAGTSLVAPPPCLAGQRLIALVANDPPPDRMLPGLPLLPVDWQPSRIVAFLSGETPLTTTLRRQRTMELRHPWPHRRFDLPPSSPAWVWEALYLGGLVAQDGTLQLTLPPAWVDAPGAGTLWRELSVRLALTALTVHTNGYQTLSLCGEAQDEGQLTVRHPDGTTERHPLLFDDAALDLVAALAGATSTATTARRKGRRTHRPSAEEIATMVFRDGIPRFPEDYLRRIEVPALRSYQLPGRLQPDSNFFDQIRLAGEDGTFVDCDNPSDAEALLLASYSGPRLINLPTDQLLTQQLVTAYHGDLGRLWQQLLDECRRHHPRQRSALTLARKLWREHDLPAAEAR